MKRFSLLITSLIFVVSLPVRADEPTPREALSEAKVGLFVAYVAGGELDKFHGSPIGDINKVADALDVNALANVAQQAGAQYLVFSAYCGGMTMNYPSKVWGDIFPYKVAKRDLVGELADALNVRGIRLILYVHPNDRHDLTVPEQQKLVDLGWASSIIANHQDPIWVDRTAEQQLGGERGTDLKWNQLYFKIIEELGKRYGSRISGYWQDGPGPDGVKVRVIMYKYTPDAAIWVNGACTRPDVPPATLWGAESTAIADDQTGPHRYPGTYMEDAVPIADHTFAPNGSSLSYPPENMYRLAVCLAGTRGQANGGFAAAAGPYMDNTWDPGVVKGLQRLGAMLKKNAISIYGTLPSKSYVSLSGTAVPEKGYPLLTDPCVPSWGVATESKDGQTTYLHVMVPPMDKVLTIDKPADGKNFISADLLNEKTPLRLDKTADHLILTLPANVTWDPVDTIIELKTSN